MSDASKNNFLGKLGEVVKDATKNLSEKIDLSGLKLPKAEAEVDLSPGVKILIGALILGFLTWLFKDN